MELKTMEEALEKYPNRFQLTMMAVARAKEINEGDSSMVVSEDSVKPVVVALREIAADKIVPSTQSEMARIRDAKRVLREKALLEAEAKAAEEEPEEMEAEAEDGPEESGAES